MLDAIISMNPAHCNLMLKGIKKVDFRRWNFRKHTPNKVFVYSTIPVKRIIGYFTFDNILRFHREEAWYRFGKYSCFDIEEYYKYMLDCDWVFVFFYKKVYKVDINPFKQIMYFTDKGVQKYKFVEDLLSNLVAEGEDNYFDKNYRGY